ncbi:recombinase family protein, partial [Eubacteriales bacterium OttesenSCG-928-A19]|nr:recombinase family protein [Eubacteriales bacterium OttesenSCG-928-A19]
VSRFARNTVDSLTTVRMLKEKGVEIYFQKENIYTLDSKGELLITIMSSLAQEESRSISENVTWGIRKRFSDGKVSLPYKHFLGYEKGEDGVPKIVESEAKIVRMIYRMFIEGKTPSAIARYLMKNGIPSPAGKKTWETATVQSILGNEKYKGDALLQKGFTVDFLTKQTKINEGEIPQYYVENSHPAIIVPEEFDAVQAELARRKRLGRPVGCGSPFSSKIFCADCGGYYGPKVWGSNTKYRRTVWRCNDKYKKGHKCKTPHLTEEQIQQGFLAAFGRLTENRDELLANCRLAQEALCDCTEIDRKLTKLRDKVDVLGEVARKAIQECARSDGDGDVSEQNRAMAQLRKVKDKVAAVEAERSERQGKAVLIQTFIREIEGRELVLEKFDERLWMVAVESVTVDRAGRLVFAFKSGDVVTV